jgi:ABC-type glutathione transport system ATPase component
MGQTIVMVTHDPSAAAYADQVVFLTDGRIVDTMAGPTAERVLERMKRLDGHGDAPAAGSRDARAAGQAAAGQAGAVAR